jgi:hypothetical protein
MKKNDFVSRLCVIAENLDILVMNLRCVSANDVVILQVRSLTMSVDRENARQLKDLKCSRKVLGSCQI